MIVVSKKLGKLSEDDVCLSEEDIADTDSSSYTN